MKHTTTNLIKSKKDQTKIHIGGVIRFYREKHNLTQSFLTEEVSSYSYLSKVENNQIIPSDSFIDDVSKKLSVNLKSMMNVIYDKNVKKALIVDYYYQDTSFFNETLRNQPILSEGPLAALLKLAIALIHKDLKQSRIHHKQLTRNKLTFGETLDQLHIVLMIDYYILSNDFFKALELFDKKPNIAYEETISIIFEQQAYIIKSALYKEREVTEHFFNFINLSQYKPNIIRNIEVNVTRILANLHKDHIDALENVKALYRMYKDYFPINMATYLFAKINKTIGNNTPNLWNKINHDVKNQWYFKCLGLLNKDEIKNDDLVEILENNEKIDGPNALEIAKLKVNTAPGDNKYFYMRDLLIPLTLKYHSLEDLNYYKEKLFEYLTQSKRYKEAFMVKDQIKKYFEKHN